jgi:hypothetical protein
MPERGPRGPLDVDPGARCRLAAIKALHTAVFAAQLASITWLVLSGLRGRRDRTVAAAGIAVALEGAVFVANRGVCPLTTMAEREGSRHGSVSDIFLPDVVARTIPTWSSALVGLAIVLHVRGAVRGRRSRPARGTRG